MALQNPHKFLAQRKRQLLEGTDEGDLFGKQIAKINDWLKSQKDYKYDDFVWTGTELKLMDKSEKVTDTLSLADVKDKVANFPEKA